MQQNKVCKFFLENRCRDGDKCRFLHVIPKNMNSSKDSRNMQLPQAPKAYPTQMFNTFNDNRKPLSKRRWNINKQREQYDHNASQNFAPASQDFRSKKDSKQYIKKEASNSTSSSLLFHLGNQEYLRDLNIDREKNMLEKLIVHSAFKYKDQAILTFVEKPFIVEYDLKNYDFTSKEQKYIHVKINHSITNLTVSQWGDLLDEFLLVAYNRFNEITMSMTACLGLIPISYLGSGQNFVEIPISNEAPINLMAMSKNFICCTFQDLRNQNSTLYIYRINRLNQGSSENIVDQLKQIQGEYKLNECVTALSCTETFLLIGTQTGDVKIFNAENDEVRNVTHMVEGEIIFLELCYQEVNNLKDLFVVCVAQNGQIAVSNNIQPRSLHSLSQNIGLARTLHYKEG